jgi:hypothetical protein
MMGFIIINSLRQFYKETGQEFPLTSSLVYTQDNSTILDKLQGLLKLANKNGNKTLANNLFIKALDRVEATSNKLDINKYGEDFQKGYATILEEVQVEIDKLTVDTRTKNASEYNNRLINAYRELTSAILKDSKTGSPVTNEQNVSVLKEFAEELFNYLVVRDGLQYANGSFLKYLAPEMYLNLSDILKELTDAFRFNRWSSTESKKGITKLLGMDKDQFTNQFIKLYGLNPKNSSNLNEVQLSNLTEIHRDFKERFGYKKDPEIIKLYRINNNGQIVSLPTYSTYKPAFIEVDMSHIQGLVDAKLFEEVSKLFDPYGGSINKAREENPDLTFFKPNGELRDFYELTEDEQSNFSDGKEYYKERWKTQQKLTNRLVKYGSEIKGTSVEGTKIVSSVAGLLSAKSAGTFEFAGNDIIFPRFIKMSRSVPAGEGYTRQETDLYMLVNAADPTGRSKEGVIQGPRGVYVQVDPIYTSLYPYLYTADEFKEVMLKYIKGKEDKYKKKASTSKADERKYSRQVKESCI